MAQLNRDNGRLTQADEWQAIFEKRQQERRVSNAAMRKRPSLVGGFLLRRMLIGRLHGLNSGGIAMGHWRFA